jgi:hypothetical protein
LPVWDNDTSNPQAQHDWSSWGRAVAVDATRDDVPVGETTTVDFMGIPRVGSTVVGLNKFYVVPVTASTLEPINQAIQNGDARLRSAILAALGRDLKVGDFILFIGTHVTSKEIDDWTWSTFWWHDKPNDGPFAKDRPDEVKGVWRNYLMALTDDQVAPREPDGSPLVGYNPWLEGKFNNGIVSNCMSCHHRAGFPPVSFLPVTRGLPDPASDPAFRPGRLQTDFMWSILFESK